MTAGRRFAAVALLAALQAAPSPGQSADEVLSRVRERYAAMKDVEVRFTQTAPGPKGTSRPPQEGVLQAKKGNRYRIETADQVVVTDGTTVWRFGRRTNQVLVDRFKPDTGVLAPDRLLSGATGEVRGTVTGRETLGGKSVVVLSVVPKEDDGAYTALKLWVDDAAGMVRKLEATDLAGGIVTITVHDVRFDAGIPDARFTFQPPAGADVVDLR